MLAEWTAECAIDAPVIEVPWSDATTGLHFVDLRSEPYDIADIAEAEAYPALNRALRSLNAQRSFLITSKADVWSMDSDELEPLRIELDLDTDLSATGVAGYIDIIMRDRATFSSAHHQQGLLDGLIRRAERLPHPEASLLCTLRPAVVDLNGTIEGFAFTLYVRALAPDASLALERWGAALEDVTALLRGREFAPARPSATIDKA